MSRFLVTGCAGFIGSHLAAALLERGEEVVGVDAFTDNYSPALKKENLASFAGDDRFSLEVVDLATDDVDSLLDGIDGVFHLAARPGVRSSFGSSFEAYTRNNVMATQRLFEAASKRGTRVVYASSSSIYGDAARFPTPEDVVPLPVSPYGVTKLACEHLAGAYARSVGLEAIGLRYFTVYGPRQRPDMAFARIVEALLRGRPFELFGTGGQSRDFTFVADAVSATVVAMAEAPPGRIYNVGGGTEASLNHVIAQLEQVVGSRLDVKRTGPATGDVQRTAADTTLIRAELGWLPQTPLAEGLHAQVEAARAGGAMNGGRVAGVWRRAARAVQR